MDARIDQLFEELVGALEEDPGFAVGEFLAGHTEEAAELRRRLERLVHLGALPRQRETASVLAELRKRFRIQAPQSATTKNADEAPTNASVLYPGGVLAGRYRIADELGRGGMGRVVRAMDLELDREVALKFVAVAEEDDESGTPFRDRLERFITEARLSSQLEHPSIVPVHDFGLAEGDLVYFTMKLVEGTTLSNVIEETHRGDGGNVATLPRALGIIEKVCDALAFAHGKGVIHRDLKPSNVMVGQFGEVQLMDWGLARVVGAPDAEPRGTGSPSYDTHQTASGFAFGTPSYMAPEQARGDRDLIDERTDVFGVGALLYHLASGNPPYWGNDLEEVLERAREGTLSDPGFREAAASVPIEVQAICRKALQADPARRYPSIRELQDDLVAVANDTPGEAWRDGPVRRLVKSVRRHPTRALAVLALLLLSVVATFAWTQSQLRALSEEELSALRIEQAFFDVQDQLAGLGETGNMDYPKLALDHVDAFAALGLPLEEGSEESAARRLTELRHRPDAFAAVRIALLELQVACIRAGVPYAHWLTTGRPFSDQVDARLVESGQRAPRLVRLWPRLRSIYDTVEEDPWRREFVDDLVETWRTQKSRIEPHLEDAELDRRSAMELVALGKIAQLLKLDAEALGVFERAAQLDPGNYWAHLNLGYLNSRRSDHASDEEQQKLLVEAERRFRLAVAIQPESSWANNNLGETLRRLGRVDEALVHVERAVATAPQNVRAIYNLGLVHLDRTFVLRRRGKPSEAERSIREAARRLREALSHRPDDVPTRIYLGQALHELKEYDEATAVLQGVIQDAPKAAGGYMYLFNVFSAQGESDEAIALAEEAVRQRPDHPTLWFQAAHELEGDGWVERALHWWHPVRNLMMNGVAFAYVQDAPPSRKIPQLVREAEVQLDLALPRNNAERIWKARYHMRRAEYRMSAEVFREALDSVTAADYRAASRGKMPWNFTLNATDAAWRASRREGFVFVPGVALLAEGEDLPRRLDGSTVTEQRMLPGERTPVAEVIEADDPSNTDYAAWAREWLELTLVQRIADLRAERLTFAPSAHAFELEALSERAQFEEMRDEAAPASGRTFGELLAEAEELAAARMPPTEGG